MASLKEIRDVVSAMAAKFHPSRIILFGSYAHQKQSPDSDVDLLVVMPHEGPAAKRAAEIREAVKLPFPCDLLVRSPEKLQERLSLGDPFFKDVILNGQVLYESTHH